jgi:hypothetical protein
VKGVDGEGVLPVGQVDLVVHRGGMGVLNLTNILRQWGSRLLQGWLCKYPPSPWITLV